MGPGREPGVCENSELVQEFELACRAGDCEFADQYKKEIVRRLWRETDVRGKRLTVTAPDILERAAGHMADRVKTYDATGGERSMGKVAGIIRTLYAEQLGSGEFTEEMAWGLQVVLKLVRTSQGGYRADNYEDGAAYFALMGECASVERWQDNG